MKFLTGKVLIIPDIHQCIGFANKALEMEFDHVVFLGDYFDCFEKPDGWYVGIKDTCAWLNETMDKLGTKATWLIGNHDLAYMATYRKRQFPSKNTFYSCSGYTRSKATEINKRLRPDFFANLELCVNVNGFICSHAGFVYEHFKPMLSAEENILALYESWERDKHSFFLVPWHWIGSIGPCRGGVDSVGSPIWLDWNVEFFPVEEIKQIVGHTNYWNDDTTMIKEKNGNFCVDKNRSLVIIVNEDGTIKKVPILKHDARDFSKI